MLEDISQHLFRFRALDISIENFDFDITSPSFVKSTSRTWSKIQIPSFGCLVGNITQTLNSYTLMISTSCIPLIQATFFNGDFWILDFGVLKLKLVLPIVTELPRLSEYMTQISFLVFKQSLACNTKYWKVYQGKLIWHVLHASLSKNYKTTFHIRPLLIMNNIHDRLTSYTIIYYLHHL